MKKILLIDDEPEIRESLRETLSGIGTDFVEAADGKEGLEQILSHGPDLVISDFNMPRMNGLELLKTLRERNVAFPPVIWLTGRGSRDLQLQTWALGIFEYLNKPYDPQQLIRMVQNLIRPESNISRDEIFRGNSVTRVLFEDASLHLTRATYFKFIEQCERDGVSVSTQIDRMIQDFLDRKTKVS